MLKKKLVQILPCIALLILFVIVHYNNSRYYFDRLYTKSGFFEVDFEAEMRKENLKALEERREYEEFINPTNPSTQPAQPTEPTEPTLKLHALSSLLMDATNHRILYENNGFNEMPMASTTKIMSCIVAIENGDLSDVVTVSSYAARMPDVQLNINTGEQYYLKDLLYSLMLESHNDVAVAIAEHVGGSVEGFAALMNEKAKELGCDNTNFVTPNGLDADGHYTTARDLAVIASYAIENDLFIRITNTAAYDFREITKGRSFRVTNKNKFLYMMDGAIGVKTGYTGKAGYCFVGAVKKADRTLVSVVLGSGWPPSRNLKWNDTKTLMNYGNQNFKVRQIFEKPNLDPLPVHNGQQKYEYLTVNADLNVLMREDEKITIEYDLPETLEAPIMENTVIGYANYYINDEFYTEVPIYTKETIDKINFKFCLDKILRAWMGYES